MLISPNDDTSAVTKKSVPARSAAPIRDLADFHLRWREFRPAAVSAADKPALSEDERKVLAWLIRMADRIGPRDLL